MPYESIKQVLRTIENEYAEAYAFAIAHTEKFPDAVNVIQVGVLKATAEQDYELAPKLAIDAVDFCYQVSVRTVWDKIEETKIAIKQECGSIPVSILDRYTSLKSRKRQLVARGLTPGNRREAAKNVFEECRDLHDEMLSEVQYDRRKGT